MQCVAIIYSGELMVSDSLDKTVRRWEASTGETIGEPLRIDNGKIVDARISENDRYIVSGSNCEIRVWDAFSGETIGLHCRELELSSELLL